MPCSKGFATLNVLKETRRVIEAWPCSLSAALLLYVDDARYL